MRKVFIAIVISMLLPLSNVFAQTPNGPPVLPSAARAQVNQQLQGNYGPNNPAKAQPPLPRGPAGQVQKAWNQDIMSTGAVTSGKGTVTFEECEECVYQIVTREMMISTIKLPAGETIITPIDVGESTSFEVKARGQNRIAVRPLLAGVDSNVVVYTKSGKEYQFYVQSDGFNSKRIPHLKIKIKGDENELAVMDESQLPKVGSNVSHFKSVKSENPLKVDAAISTFTPSSGKTEAPIGGPKEEEKKDYIESVSFKPGGIHGFLKYSTFGSKELEPVAVYRNERFTFIHYGDKWTELELPTAYVVYDDVDELVNTRVEGSTFIIESLSNVITLKAGQKHLCIVYDGSA